MVFIKYMILLTILGGSSGIGFLISQKYKDRVQELKTFKEIVNTIETKIKFTYEPLKEIFTEISYIFKDKEVISNIFNNIKSNMENYDVKTSWELAINSSKTKLNLNKEDINILKGIGKLLRKN